MRRCAMCLAGEAARYAAGELYLPPSRPVEAPVHTVVASRRLRGRRSAMTQQGTHKAGSHCSFQGRVVVTHTHAHTPCKQKTCEADRGATHTCRCAGSWPALGGK